MGGSNQGNQNIGGGGFNNIGGGPNNSGQVRVNNLDLVDIIRSLICHSFIHLSIPSSIHSSFQDNFGWPGGFAAGNKGAGGPAGFGIGGNRGPPPGMPNPTRPGGSWTAGGTGGGGGGGGQNWGEASSMYNQISSCIVLKNLTPQVCVFAG